MKILTFLFFLLYHVYTNTGQAYGRFIQTQPSYYREIGYMVHQKENVAKEKRRRKLHPILTLEVTLYKQINTIECASMDIT